MSKAIAVAPQPPLLPPSVLRAYHLPAAILHEYPDHIHTYLADGSDSAFWPPLSDPDYVAAMVEMGYSDGMRYAVDHEIAHHLVAEWGREAPERTVWVWNMRSAAAAEMAWDGPARQIGFSVSRIIHHACHSLPMSLAEPESAAEEHLVNRLQRWVNLGAGDPFGELERVFGARLVGVGRELVRLSRPWLAI